MNEAITILTRTQMTQPLFDTIKTPEDWHFGYLKKSHYAINQSNKIVGCLNLIYLFKDGITPIFYFDTIEIKKDLRRKGLGIKFFQFVLNATKGYNEYSTFFLLVSNCVKFKLDLFRSLGFSLIKLRETQTGTHCILTLPLCENSQRLCEKVFRYFQWREQQQHIISSDCRYAHNLITSTGLYWCEKKQIYVSGLEKQYCDYYIQEKDIFFKKKFLITVNEQDQVLKP